jgi:uncharacterized protein (TIRG00374 family)
LKRANPFAILSDIQDSGSGKNRWVIVFSIAIAVFLLYLALRDMDWGIFFQKIEGAQYAYLPIVFLWTSISFLVRAFRLRVLLSGERVLPVSHVFRANMTGYLGNNLLPARAGELLRATYFARQDQMSISYALAVGLVERLMDLMVLIILGGLALSSLEVMPPVFQNGLKVVCVFGIVVLAAVFMLPFFQNLIESAVMKSSFLKEEHKIKLEQFLQQFITGLKSLHSTGRVLQFISITFLVWLVDALGLMLLAYIFEMTLLLQQALLLLAALGLSSVIPSTPGYVGVYQFVAITTLAPFGISQPDALAFILASQIVGYIVVGFWGVLSLWQLNRDSQS